MEEKLNAIGKLERYRYSKTLICGLNLGLIILAVIAMGIFLLISRFFWLSGICMAIGVVMIILEVFLLNKINKIQKQIYNHRHQLLQNEIETIISNVKRFTGGKYEE